MLRNKQIRLVKIIPVYLFILLGLNSSGFFRLQFNRAMPLVSFETVRESLGAIANTKILARSEPLDDQVPKQPSDRRLEQQRQQLRERQQQIREQYRKEQSQQQQQRRDWQKIQQQESQEYRRQDRERINQRNELRREEEKNRQRRQLIIQPRH